MKDMFGRHIAEGDTVTYAVRHGSSMDTRIAKVLKVEDKRVRVAVVAGTGWAWERGSSWYDAKTQTFKSLPFEGYETWLRTPHNVLVSNGIDALGIREGVLQRQRVHLAKKAGL